jgi:O-antigen/teichoic acid export membrane protein
LPVVHAPLKNRWGKRLGGYAATIISQIGFGLVTTYIGLSLLSADDYGAYALISIVTALLASLAAGPAGIISAGSYLNLSAHEKAVANTTFALLTLAIAVSEITLFFYLFPFFEHVIEKPIGSYERYFACLCILPQALFMLYTNINYNQGYSGRVLAATVGQGVTGLITIYVGLYVFSFGAASLYFSQLAGFVVAAILCMLFAGRMHRPTRAWLARWRQASGSYSANTLITNLPALVENFLIARFAGLTNLAAWQHSRIYNAFVMRVGKVVGLTILPTALKEARNGKFPITRRAWRGAYVGYAVMGVWVTFFVEPLIDFLTHGKLLEASAIAPWWVVYNLLQSTGREAEATLYSSDFGTQVINAQSEAKVVALMLIIPFLYLFGLAGALGAALVEVLCFRFFIRRNAMRVRPIPSIDGWAFGASALIVAAIILEYALSPLDMTMRLAAASAVTLGIAILAKPVIFDVFSLYKSGITISSRSLGDNI